MAVTSRIRKTHGSGSDCLLIIPKPVYFWHHPLMYGPYGVCEVWIAACSNDHYGSNSANMPQKCAERFWFRKPTSRCRGQNHSQEDLKQECNGLQPVQIPKIHKITVWTYVQVVERTIAYVMKKLPRQLAIMGPGAWIAWSIGDRWFYWPPEWGLIILF